MSWWWIAIIGAALYVLIVIGIGEFMRVGMEGDGREQD